MAVVLDRFREPDEVEVVVASCEHCKEDIYNYQEVSEGELFCDDFCLLDWYKKQVGAQSVTAGEFVGQGLGW